MARQGSQRPFMAEIQGQSPHQREPLAGRSPRTLWAPQRALPRQWSNVARFRNGVFQEAPLHYEVHHLNNAYALPDVSEQKRPLANY